MQAMVVAVKKVKLRRAKMITGFRRRLVTDMIKDDGNGGKPLMRQRPWLQRIRIVVFYGYSPLLVTRLLLCAVALNSKEVLPDYFDYDPFFNLYVKRFGFIDRYLALVLWPGPLLLMHVDYLATFIRLPIYQLGYDLVVRNRIRFWVLNPQLNKQRLLIVVYNVSMLVVTWNIVNERESIGNGLKFILIIVDRATLLWVFWHGATVLFAFILSVNLVMYAFIAQLRQMNRRLVVRCFRVGKGAAVQGKQKRSKRKLLFAEHFQQYMRQHFRMVLEVVRSNKQIVSSLLLTVIIVVTGLNIYAVSMLTLNGRSLSLAHQTMLLVLCVKQFVFSAFGLWPMMVLSSELHRRPSVLIYRSLMYVKCRGPLEGGAVGGDVVLLLKMQLATYFEMINGEEKFAFSAGPIGKVTKSAMFEFICFYVGYLLFTFDLILSN
ncbi:hypothetical protein TYRP_014830 [Tyrophagus putrescentiae]|nr:hypothetical protein TYRP_014830 [Tyrophagus putrescentiae]